MTRGGEKKNQRKRTLVKTANPGEKIGRKWGLIRGEKTRNQKEGRLIKD